MIIHYENDQKEKYQSVRASSSLQLSTPMGYVDVFIEGFGRDEHEATKEFMRVVGEMISWTKPE